MKLSKKLKINSQFPTAFLKSTFNFKYYGKKDESSSLCFSKTVNGRIRVYVNV